jgi:hypothetical protein
LVPKFGICCGFTRQRLIANFKIKIISRIRQALPLSPASFPGFGSHITCGSRNIRNSSGKTSTASLTMASRVSRHSICFVRLTQWYILPGISLSKRRTWDALSEYPGSRRFLAKDTIVHAWRLGAYKNTLRVAVFSLFPACHRLSSETP